MGGVRDASIALRHRFTILFFLLGCCLLLLREFAVRPDGQLSVSFLDVGQGDAALLHTPSGRQVLIDGGPDSSVLEEIGRRMSFFDRTIDLLVLSHPNLDHLSGLVEVLRRYDVRLVLLPAVLSDLPRFQEFLALLKEQHVRVILADASQDIDLGNGVRLDVVWPPAGFSADDENAYSVVLRVTYGSDSVLFTGDIGADTESAVIASGADIEADILKVPHHGSRYSSSTGFLLAVDPTLAVIPVGENTYGHPHPTVLRRLGNLGIAVKMTLDEGTIDIALDGQ